MAHSNYKPGMVLTLKSGEMWKVRDVRAVTVDNAQRMCVGLVKPYNLKLGTAFYADVLDDLVICVTSPAQERRSL